MIKDKKFMFVVLFLVLLGLLIGCAPKSAEVLETDPAMVKKLQVSPYVNKKAGFQISIPKGWRVDASGQFGDAIFFFNNFPDEEGEITFSANVNIKAVSVPDEMGLGEAIVEVKKNISATPAYKLLSEKAVISNGQEAHIFYVSINQGDAKVKSEQLLVRGEAEVYIVTATVLASTWNKYQGLLETVLATFKPI